MRIVFAGTPEFAVPSLKQLIDGPHEVVAVYTQPDRPKGRGRQLAASPVKLAAQSAGIPVLQPSSLKAKEEVERLQAFKPDYLIVAAYGLLLSDEVLAIPTKRAINVHASLLPRWRGASPIQQAILAGDAKSGVTIMQMVRALDAGDSLLQAECVITKQETAASLHDKLAVIGAEALNDYLIRADEVPGIAQDADLVTYAPKLVKADARLDWTQTAAQLERQVRAFQPWPVAALCWQDELWRVWQARLDEQVSDQPPGTVLAVDRDGIAVATGDGILVIESWQRPGGKAVSVREYLNAHPQALLPGETVFS